MPVRIPKAIRKLRPGRLVASAADNDVVLYLREEDWGMKKYPRQCPIELCMGTWPIGSIIVTAILVRLARNDLTTFEFFLNAGDPEGVRTLQCLGSQSQIDLHIVADRDVRSLRAANPMRFDASMLVNRLRGRDAWPPEDFQKACMRVAQLYPNAHSLWWACQEANAT